MYNEKQGLSRPMGAVETEKFIASYEGDSQMDTDTIIGINPPDDICDILEDIYNNFKN